MGGSIPPILPPQTPRSIRDQCDHQINASRLHGAPMGSTLTSSADLSLGSIMNIRSWHPTFRPPLYIGINSEHLHQMYQLHSVRSDHPDHSIIRPDPGFHWIIKIHMINLIMNQIHWLDCILRSFDHEPDSGFHRYHQIIRS